MADLNIPASDSPTNAASATAEAAAPEAAADAPIKLVEVTNDASLEMLGRKKRLKRNHNKDSAKDEGRPKAREAEVTTAAAANGTGEDAPAWVADLKVQLTQMQSSIKGQLDEMQRKINRRLNEVDDRLTGIEDRLGDAERQLNDVNRIQLLVLMNTF